MARDILKKRLDEAESLDRHVRETVAKSLREFGYPHCNADNVLTDMIYRAFAKSQLEEVVDEHPNSRLAPACRRLLEQIKRTEEMDAANEQAE